MAIIDFAVTWCAPGHGKKRLLHLLFRDAGVGGGGGIASPVLGRSINPIPTRGDRLYPPHYYRSPQIFGQCGVSAFNLKMLQYHPSFSGVLCSILFRDIFGDIYRVVDCGGGFGPMNPPFRDNTSHKNGDN